MSFMRVILDPSVREVSSKVQAARETGDVRRFVSGRREGVLGGLLRSARWSTPNATGCDNSELTEGI